MEATNVIKKLGIDKPGRYDNQFYIIDLEDSNDYARMYTLLNDKAVNTEYPSFGVNTNNSTVKATNYFEVNSDNITYLLFLIADFDKDKYYLKIGEK